MQFGKYNRTNCPCRNCEDRHQGCHAKCERYGAWRKGIDNLNEKEHEFHKSRDTMSEMNKRRLWRSKRYGKNVKLPHGINDH